MHCAAHHAIEHLRGNGGLMAHTIPAGLNLVLGFIIGAIGDW